MSTELVAFAEKKSSLARELNNGGCGGSYSDSVLIISSSISGIASLLWHGESIDRFRFIELLVKYSLPELRTKIISLPLLINYLEDSKDEKKVKMLRKKFMPQPDGQVLIGIEVDQDENTVISICSDIPLKDLRIYSYASLLYKYLRSPIVHEYALTGLADSFKLTRRDSDISYVNYLDKRGNRKIHFGLEWLIKVLNSIANSVQPFIDKLPLGNPSSWWIQG